MTNEKAIKILSDWDGYFVGHSSDDVNEALDLAIKAIEAQPTDEDCISREAVEKITWEEPSYTDALNVLTEVREKIRQLPSVTSQRPKGKWIANYDESEDIHTINCSCCGYRLVGVLNSGFTKEQALDCAKDEIKNAPFCCKCGTDMSGGGEDG